LKISEAQRYYKTHPELRKAKRRIPLRKGDRGVAVANRRRRACKQARMWSALLANMQRAGKRSLISQHAILHTMSWLRVFRSAHTAYLSHGGGKREPRVVPSEKTRHAEAACRRMRVSTACFALHPNVRAAYVAFSPHVSKGIHSKLAPVTYSSMYMPFPVRARFETTLKTHATWSSIRMCSPNHSALGGSLYSPVDIARSRSWVPPSRSTLRADDHRDPSSNAKQVAVHDIGASSRRSRRGLLLAILAIRAPCSE